MRIGLTISVLLHGLVLLSLYWPQNKAQVTALNGGQTMLSLISEKRTPRKKRVKKNKVLKGKTNFKKTKKQKPSLGNDQVNAKEIRAASNYFGKMGPASYGQQLVAYIANHRFYPRRAQAMQQTGTVKLRLTINQDGLFTNIEVIEESDFDILNRAAKDLITELGSFKPLPKKFNGSKKFVVPIRYYSRDLEK